MFLWPYLLFRANANSRKIDDGFSRIFEDFHIFSMENVCFGRENVEKIMKNYFYRISSKRSLKLVPLSVLNRFLGLYIVPHCHNLRSKCHIFSRNAQKILKIGGKFWKSKISKIKIHDFWLVESLPIIQKSFTDPQPKGSTFCGFSENRPENLQISK